MKGVVQMLPGDMEASPGLLWDECRKEEDKMPLLIANTCLGLLLVLKQCLMPTALSIWILAAGHCNKMS